MKATPELRKEAHDTATTIACPHCGQGPGQTCVTTRLNEAAFTHMKRVRFRLAQMLRQG